MSRGRLIIIPIPISETPLENVLPDYNAGIIKDLRFFVVENIKTSRQFLRKMDSEFPIDDSIFFEQDKHNSYAVEGDIMNVLNDGNDVGIMSESGYPGIADPGSKIVALAQEKGIEVVPLVGPSSILMALAASGMNGQGFTFNGYLPIKEPERSKQIRFINNLIQKTGFTQIFIETPHRNQSIFEDFLIYCPDGLKMCVAYDVTGENQMIMTKTIGEWKKGQIEFDKTPTVFVLG